MKGFGKGFRIYQYLHSFNASFSDSLERILILLEFFCGKSRHLSEPERCWYDAHLFNDSNSTKLFSFATYSCQHMEAPVTVT